MSDISHLILSQEELRCAAMRSADLDALDNILDADLYFCHANGVIDDKAIYLGKMAQGNIVYRSIEWSDQQVSLLPGQTTALLTGRMTSEVSVSGVEKLLDNRVVGIWVNVDDQWRLRGFQTTPLPKS
ncbi:nuclear transport factor 2 family protein [Zhongshania sp.]|uniref:nuclear transport factor 2 family protein n=1 Tax=Zhongshania sp. TaxID=1971902 RepID=UPI003561B4C2